MLSACQIHGLATSRELILSFSFSRSDVFFAHNIMGPQRTSFSHLTIKEGKMTQLWMICVVSFKEKALRKCPIFGLPDC